MQMSSREMYVTVFSRKVIQILAEVVVISFSILIVFLPSALWLSVYYYEPIQIWESARFLYIILKD